MRGLRAVRPPANRRLGMVQRIALTVEIAQTYQRAWRLMRSVDLPTALARLRAATPSSEGHADTADIVLGRRLGRAVMLVLAVLPTDKRCLIRSLTLSALVARRGIDARLVIGVKPRTTEPFIAHAWVEIADTPVLPVEGYEQLHSL